MVDIFSLCERIYYINLDHRIDRRRHIEQQLSPFNNVVRVSAVPGGYNGCTSSHLLVVQDAIYRKHKVIGVFEDDFTFSENNFLFDEGRFDVIQLAYSQMIPFDNSTKRVKQSLTSSGLIIHCNFFEKWKLILLESLHNNVPLDITMQAYQAQYKWYAVKIGYQNDSISDIS